MEDDDTVPDLRVNSQIDTLRTSTSVSPTADADDGHVIAPVVDGGVGERDFSKLMAA
eukprot:COSAG02_NODE_36357_length_455_cov_1.876404_2_plen_56_part_01